MPQQKHCVFRFYDASQALLFVSVSQRSLPKEIAALSKTPWIDSVDAGRTDITWHATLEEANAARNAAIKTGKPLHNREPEKVRKTVDISGETQAALRRRLDNGADHLAIPVLSGQKYLAELITVALEDDEVHQQVLERLRDKIA